MRGAWSELLNAASLLTTLYAPTLPLTHLSHSLVVYVVQSLVRKVLTK